MWFDRRLVMRKSPIHGTGLYATDDIRAGECLMWISGGIVFTSEDWQTGRVQLDPEMYNEEKLDDDLFVATPKCLHYYMNHSCDPNVVNYRAWRDIQAGEEITTEYGLSGEISLEPCQCGSPLCRGRVTKSDWRQPEFQQRYRGQFPVRLEQRIRQMNISADL
jgi:hypothetical protein